MAEPTSHQFPIVGIGASAGGVEALSGFFKGLPANPGLGFVIVTHLSPERESLLHEIVARYTDMPVCIAADGAVVGPNSVHVLPADAILDIEDGRLRIRKLGASRRERKPIDIFLSALARDRGEYAAGVILSGGDSDGTLGIKAIKERGGLTLAQVADGDGPSHADMPASAISSGMVDLAVPADQMGVRLVEFARGFGMLDGIIADERDAAGDLDWSNARAEICALLRNQVGHDFEGYKVNTFLRRVQRRMQVNQIESIQAYVERLRQEPREVSALFRDLLINVTNFFRDREAFESLKALVIPKLFEGRSVDDTIRVWIPGCATGEEVFSVAILMREHMDTLPAPPRVQIFATDIDDVALTAARTARYPDALLDNISDERRRRFFSGDGGSYQIVKDVRDLCIFSPHSVLRDPPFSRIDLVSCRNLLIYFGTDLQNQVIPTFHYSLRPGGYLFLGMAENVSQFADLFTSVDKKSRIFRSRSDVAPVARVPTIVRAIANESLVKASPSSFIQPTGGATRQLIDREVLDRYAPPHVVVNGDGDVVYYSARTGKYLEPPQGTPSRQLIATALKTLRLDLRAAFKQAVSTGQVAVRADIALDVEDARVQLVTITVQPIPTGARDDALYLVLFTDTGPLVSRDEAIGRFLHKVDDAAVHLERELRDTRERLQAMIEEYETAVEELKSSNEELVSVNEELQSTNEELEASKEELQSLNEELHTVNAELVRKVDDLDRAKSDLENLFESTRIATVFLDRDLIIRSFTPAASAIFNIRAGDAGRSIADFSSRLPLPNFADDIRAVIACGEPRESRIESRDGDRHYFARLMPYRNLDEKIDGVVLTFVDVTSLTKAEAHQQVLIAELNHRVKNMLTIAIAVIEQTMVNGKSAAELRSSLTERLRAMARAYGALSRENWESVALADLVGQELAPFGRERFTLDGPPLRVKPRLALSIGMVVHELATNAAKYGAFSVAGGRLTVTWCTDDDEFTLTWQERGGPTVVEPATQGFGLKLMINEATYTLAGHLELKFDSKGLEAVLICKL
jgi:two-component system, chemotaxis family, CheB/CheR fusion protein